MLTTRRQTVKAQAYCRERDLPRILPLWPAELADPSADAQRRLIVKLRRALREERRRGLAGHWAYDLARHAALHRAELAAERTNRMRTSRPEPELARGTRP